MNCLWLSKWKKIQAVECAAWDSVTSVQRSLNKHDAPCKDQGLIIFSSLEPPCMQNQR